MTRPVLLEVREARGRFGRAVKWAFWVLQVGCLLSALGTCAVVTPYLGNDDPDVVAGAGLFGAFVASGVALVWPAGTVVLGILLLLTRGRKRYIPAPPG